MDEGRVTRAESILHTRLNTIPIACEKVGLVDLGEGHALGLVLVVRSADVGDVRGGLEVANCVVGILWEEEEVYQS